MKAEIDIAYLGEGVYHAKITTPKREPRPNVEEDGGGTFHFRGPIESVLAQITQHFWEEVQLCPVTED